MVMKPAATADHAGSHPCYSPERRHESQRSGVYVLGVRPLAAAFAVYLAPQNIQTQPTPVILRAAFWLEGSHRKNHAKSSRGFPTAAPPHTAPAPAARSSPRALPSAPSPATHSAPPPRPHRTDTQTASRGSAGSQSSADLLHTWRTAPATPAALPACAPAASPATFSSHPSPGIVAPPPAAAAGQTA